MNELVIMHDQQAVTTSLKVAEVFGKKHSHVVRAIKDKINSAQNWAQYQKMFGKEHRNVIRNFGGLLKNE